MSDNWSIEQLEYQIDSQKGNIRDYQELHAVLDAAADIQDDHEHITEEFNPSEVKRACNMMKRLRRQVVENMADCQEYLNELQGILAERNAGTVPQEVAA